MISHICILQRKKLWRSGWFLMYKKWLWKSELYYIWPSIPNQTKTYNIFMAVFIDHWPWLLTTKLSYAQLYKWGHSKCMQWQVWKSYHNLKTAAQWFLLTCMHCMHIKITAYETWLDSWCKTPQQQRHFYLYIYLWPKLPSFQIFI